jgi:hypothetical protein
MMVYKSKEYAPILPSAVLNEQNQEQTAAASKERLLQQTAKVLLRLMLGI